MTASDAPAPGLSRQQLKTLALASLGGALEFYDFVVFVFFAISNFLLFLLALAIGAVVGGLAVTFAKSIGRSDADNAPEDAVDLEHAHAPVHVPASAASA